MLEKRDTSGLVESVVVLAAGLAFATLAAASDAESVGAIASSMAAWRFGEAITFQTIDAAKVKAAND